MVTTNTEVRKKTREEKVAILLGEMTVSRSEMDAGDWCEVISRLVARYKPYLKYINGLETKEERYSRLLSRLPKGKSFSSESWTGGKEKFFPLFSLQDGDNWSAVLLSNDGGVYSEEVSIIGSPSADPNEKFWRFVFRETSLDGLLGFVTVLEHRGAKNVWERIVTGIYTAFERTEARASERLQCIGFARGQLHETLGPRLVGE